MSKLAIFTMDVEAFCDTECLKGKGLEEYNQMFDGINNYLNLLEKYNIKANLFVIANIIDQIQDILKKAVTKGHKLGIHGLSHTPPLLLSNEQFASDIKVAKHKIETTFDTKVYGHRAPCFSINVEKLEELKKIGIIYDSSYIDTNITYYRKKININSFKKVTDKIYKNDNFYEFAISTNHKFPVSGGGYVRLFPWAFVKKQLIKYLDNNELFIFYLHPFEVSNVKLPKIKRIRLSDRFYLSYNRSEKYLDRIEKIINILIDKGFEFATFEDILEKTD